MTRHEIGPPAANALDFRFAKVAPGLVCLAVFWVVALLLWRSTGHLFFLFNFGYLGSAVGAGMAAFAVLPRKRKSAARRFSQALVGIYMLGYLGFWARENMQLEGLFSYLLAGFFGGALIHYLVAKIFGPLVWGRGWCGWACWTATALEQLPYHRSPGRMGGKWGRLRYAMFAASFAVVAVPWFGFGHRVERSGTESLVWLVAGNVLYYALGIGLAFALRDNRAFCKYLCPVAVPLKAGARWSLMKIGGEPGLCNGCGACERTCPMDVPVREFVRSGRRVESTECILCQTCVHTCPREALNITLKRREYRAGDA
jgi:ferredoxin-type protein NapH